MPLIELSAITGPLAKMGVDKAFTSLKRKEAVIKVRAQLKLPSEPEAGNFQSIYNHALVEWGMFKPEPVLDFFRDEYIYEAFRQSFTTGDTAILADEAENAVQRAEETGAFRRLEYDPRREITAFTAVFNIIVTGTLPAGDARRDVALARMQRQMDDMLILLNNMSATEARAAAIGGDDRFSGQLQNVIIDLLSRMTDPIVHTGGGGYVAGDVHAGGDAYLGAKNIQGDEVHGDKITYMSPDPSPPSPRSLARSRHFARTRPPAARLAHPLRPQPAVHRPRGGFVGAGGHLVAACGGGDVPAGDVPAERLYGGHFHRHRRHRQDAAGGRVRPSLRSLSSPAACSGSAWPMATRPLSGARWPTAGR